MNDQPLSYEQLMQLIASNAKATQANSSAIAELRGITQENSSAIAELREITQENSSAISELREAVSHIGQVTSRLEEGVKVLFESVLEDRAIHDARHQQHEESIAEMQKILVRLVSGESRGDVN